MSGRAVGSKAKLAHNPCSPSWPGVAGPTIAARACIDGPDTPGHDVKRKIYTSPDDPDRNSSSVDLFPTLIYIQGMETSFPPQAIDLSPQLYHQLVYTLMGLLPPPIDDSPEALRARNHTAIAKVAALLPVGANEIDLAAQCIAARAQAEEMLRLVRQNASDIELVMRLNAQYGSMVRTSLSVLGKLMRVQAVRQKREVIDGTATEDAWTLHVAERSMLKVADPGAKPQQAERPGAARVGVPSVAPVEAPAAGVDQRIEETVSENGANSHGVAFEARLSEQHSNRGARGLAETGLPEGVREAMGGSLFAISRLRGRDLPSNGRESPGRAD